MKKFCSAAVFASFSMLFGLAGCAVYVPGPAPVYDYAPYGYTAPYGYGYGPPPVVYYGGGFGYYRGRHWR